MIAGTDAGEFDPRAYDGERKAQERFGRCSRTARGLRLEGDGVLAVGVGRAEAPEGNVGRCVAHEVGWFGGDQIWVGYRVLGTDKRRRMKTDLLLLSIGRLHRRIARA